MISEVYAMAPPQGNGQPQSGAMGMFLPIIVIFGIFYFLIIRPQKKKEVQHQKFLSELKKGDEVVTQAGIYGRVAGITEKVVTLDLGSQLKIRIAKSSIVGLAPANQENQAA